MDNTAGSIQIRKYETRDRGAVRRIAVLTAFAGEPAARFIDGDDILADGLTAYFTDYEPESCFVAERVGQVVGYLIGSVDTRRMSLSSGTIARRILWKTVSSGFFLKKKNLAFLGRAVISFFRGEFFMPDLKGYPATLHINLLAEDRRSGAGSALMGVYIDYLVAQKVAGVKMATMSLGAGEFFRKHGFTLLYKGRRSYFRHITGKDFPLHVFGRRLTDPVKEAA
jgi:hypothetical protein